MVSADRVKDAKAIALRFKDKYSAPGLIVAARNDKGS